MDIENVCWEYNESACPWDSSEWGYIMTREMKDINAGEELFSYYWVKCVGRPGFVQAIFILHSRALEGRYCTRTTNILRKHMMLSNIVLVMFPCERQTQRYLFSVLNK